MTGTFSRAYGSPMRYIQGPGEIENLCRFTSELGTYAYVLILSLIHI